MLSPYFWHEEHKAALDFRNGTWEAEKPQVTALLSQGKLLLRVFFPSSLKYGRPNPELRSNIINLYLQMLWAKRHASGNMFPFLDTQGFS